MPKKDELLEKAEELGLEDVTSDMKKAEIEAAIEEHETELTEVEESNDEPEVQDEEVVEDESPEPEPEGEEGDEVEEETPEPGQAVQEVEREINTPGELVEYFHEMKNADRLAEVIEEFVEIRNKVTELLRKYSDEDLRKQ